MGKDDLKPFIQNSHLPDEDKQLWDEVLDITGDEQKEVLADFIEDEDQLLFLTDNIKSKKEYLESGDEELLGKIMEAEREDLLSTVEL